MWKPGAMLKGSRIVCTGTGDSGRLSRVFCQRFPTLPGSPAKQENSMQPSHCDSVIPAPIALPRRAAVIIQALLAMSLGIFIVGVVGFSHISVVHNAAHDTRHSNAFPCH
jgi:cobalt transporter subunit CbtB